MEQGDYSDAEIRELLQAFWVKFNNHPSPPKTGVTAKESNTFTDFALINLGGVKADGSDAVNEMSYILLDIIEEMRILQPSSMVQLSKKNPDRFIKRALKVVKTGFGQPSIFNTDAIIQELTRQGKDLIDARNGGASGCVESGAFGTEAYFLTGYFNIPKVLEITLHNGFDPRTGKAIGIKNITATIINNKIEPAPYFPAVENHLTPNNAAIFINTILLILMYPFPEESFLLIGFLPLIYLIIFSEIAFIRHGLVTYRYTCSY